MEKTITVKLANGLHARPATRLVKIAGSFKSSIILRHGDKEINAKKLIALMKAGIKHGEEITLIAHGEDEAEALQAVEHFFMHDED